MARARCKARASSYSELVAPCDVMPLECLELREREPQDETGFLDTRSSHGSVSFAYHLLFRQEDIQYNLLRKESHFPFHSVFHLTQVHLDKKSCTLI
jgi:hypothetical protein